MGEQWDAWALALVERLVQHVLETKALLKVPLWVGICGTLHLGFPC